MAVSGVRLSIELTPEQFEVIAARVAELLAASEPQTGSGFLTVDEAADYIRASRQRVYDLCSAGVLPRYKDGSRLLLRRKDLDDHLAGALPRERLLPPSTGARKARRRRSAR